MNVKEYITALKTEELSLDAATSYNQYNEKYPNISSFGYYRTQFNNHKKNSITTVIETTKDTIESITDDSLSLGVLDIKKFNLNDKHILLEPIPTGTFFDNFISKRGGLMRKCVDVTAGPPGAGKTYMNVALAAAAKKLNSDLNVGFISCEMRESEWLEEIVDNPVLADVQVVFMLNYLGKSNYLKILEEAISKFDVVVVDSFAVILHHLALIAKKGASEKKMIFDLISFFIDASEKFNNNIQLITQVVKDGSYKGSTELPHMTSSLRYVRSENGQRYTRFEKNRNNGNTIQRVLYFTKNKEQDGAIDFNMDTYKATYEQVADKKSSIRDFLLSKNLRAEESTEAETTIEERGLGEETEEERAALEAHFRTRNNSSEVLENNPELSAELEEEEIEEDFSDSL